MKITILAVEKQDGSFEVLYAGRNGDPALDQFDAIRKARGVNADKREKYVEAAVFQRPVTRKRAKFAENMLPGGEKEETKEEKPPVPTKGKEAAAKAAAATPPAGGGKAAEEQTSTTEEEETGI